MYRFSANFFFFGLSVGQPRRWRMSFSTILFFASTIWRACGRSTSWEINLVGERSSLFVPVLYQPRGRSVSNAQDSWRSFNLVGFSCRYVTGFLSSNLRVIYGRVFLDSQPSLSLSLSPATRTPPPRTLFGDASQLVGSSLASVSLGKTRTSSLQPQIVDEVLVLVCSGRIQYVGRSCVNGG